MFYPFCCHSFLQKRELSLTHEEAEVQEITARDLPSEQDIIKLLINLRKANREDEILWVVIAAISGRRFVDVSRIYWKNVVIRNDRICILLQKDKCNQARFVNFSFKFSDWDLPQFNIDMVVEKFKADKINLSRNAKVIGKAKKHIIKIRCENLFRMHSLRNRASIKLIISGKSEQEVQAAIGWRTIQSLYRYTILSLSELKNFNNYQEAYDYIIQMRL